MAEATELLVAEEREHLKGNALLLGWSFEAVDTENFIVGMTAKDGSPFFLWCDCANYSAVPPAWHWYNPETKRRDDAQDAAVGGGFLHGHGVICAPWNRLAYKKIDARGPHDDWDIANWRTNSYTRKCQTLSAMALRIFSELNADTFKGRKANHA